MIGMWANMIVGKCLLFVTSYHFGHVLVIVNCGKFKTMIAKRITQVFLGLMGLAFCKVGIETLINPQAVLDAVGIELTNPSAFSSMRAVYGGMHLAFGLFCIYGIWKDLTTPLKILILYTAGFVVGRLSGLAIEGHPNEFVSAWLVTEIVSGVISGGLLYFIKVTERRIEKRTLA
jgi:hypothetical protein